jgi:hypothetical protein
MYFHNLTIYLFYWIINLLPFIKEIQRNKYKKNDPSRIGFIHYPLLQPILPPYAFIPLLLPNPLTKGLQRTRLLTQNPSTILLTIRKIACISILRGLVKGSFSVVLPVHKRALVRGFGDFH